MKHQKKSGPVHCLNAVQNNLRIFLRTIPPLASRRLCEMERLLLMLTLSGLDLALAHQGRPLSDPSLPLWARGLLVVFTVLSLLMLLRGVNSIMTLSRKSTDGHRMKALWQVLGSGVVFTCLMVFMLQTPRTIPEGHILLIEQKSGWEAHYADGSHEENTLRVKAGEMVTLKLQPRENGLFRIPRLGIEVELQQGQTTQLMLVLPVAGTYATSETGLQLFAQ